jgi:hypothetical protein
MFVSKVNSKHILYGIIIVLIILLLFFAFGNIDNDVVGVWYGATDFMEKANLKDMILYISKPESNITSNIFPCYLFIESTDEIMIDKKIEIIQKKSMSNDTCIQVPEVPFWNLGGSLRMKYNPQKKCILIYSGNTVLAKLYRDNHASDYAEAI